MQIWIEVRIPINWGVSSREHRTEGSIRGSACSFHNSAGEVLFLAVSEVFKRIINNVEVWPCRWRNECEGPRKSVLHQVLKGSGRSVLLMGWNYTSPFLRCPATDASMYLFICLSVLEQRLYTVVLISSLWLLLRHYSPYIFRILKTFPRIVIFSRLF